MTEGFCAPGFEPVAAAFADNFAHELELGAAFAAHVDGEPVVDIWGGSASADGATPWTRDSLQVIFSGTKGLAALSVLLLVDRGELELDGRMAGVWPEFAQGGKADVTVRDALTHRAGVPAFKHARVAPHELADSERMAALTAAEPAWWPGERRVAYHGLTFGWLCGELVLRTTGVSLGEWFRTQVAEPLGLEAWIGLPPELEPRVTELVRHDTHAAPERNEIEEGAYSNPPVFARPLIWNEPFVHQAEIGGAGGIATARSMARLYGCLALGGELDGVRIIGEDTLELARERQFEERDAVYGSAQSYGLGFQRETFTARYGGVQDAFGHDGAGGSVHGAWPSLRTGFSYAMNHMRHDELDTRRRRLLDALHGCVRRRAERGSAGLQQEQVA